MIGMYVLKTMFLLRHGADTVVLPAVEDLSFETKHVCDQFITHHLDRCRDAIAKDTRYELFLI
jgi:hypothetical protein